MLTAVVVFLRTIALICSGHRAVALENVALRQQLAVLKRTVKRPQLRQRDRLFWILLANAWRDWRQALVFVRPDTVVRWHREWLRRRWAARSRPSRRGRPSTDVAIETLIAKMSGANPLWGAPRIHGELRKLGIDVSERTVSRLLRRRPHRPSHTWRTFLANHLAALVSMDFFTVPTLTAACSSSLCSSRTNVDASSMSRSPSIRRQLGRRNRLLKPSPTTLPRDGWCEIVTRSTVRGSGAAWPVWASLRSCVLRRARGRIRTPND
jgi:hypothetical protein